MQQLKFRGYKLFTDNVDAAESMMRQADEFPSFFSPAGDRPWIIDCGSNIGVSVLEWKVRWPHAQIVCFEPDPFAFEVLKLNVDANDIPNVQCVNAALYDRDDTIRFYGEIGGGADSRGNSLDPAWGQRDGTSAVDVVCKRLSSYLADREISFLKLDIEGAELCVLKEIADHLERIQAIYVEVHETNLSTKGSALAEIKQLLSESGFEIEIEPRYSEHAFPAHLEDWQQSVGARQTQLLCWR